MSENWIPRVDSTTSYLGIQCIPEILNESFHAFQTISSDDVLWDVYFNVKTLEPQFARAEASSQGEISYVIIPPGSYKPRSSGFERSEFMPQKCFE